MPWQTPSLRQVREMVRDDITSALSGAVLVGNSVLRVMSDANAGLAHLTLRYIDWLSRQLLPDTAETEWLDRHGNIWLTNADHSTGRKVATVATGSINITGTPGTIVPIATQLTSGVGINYETTEQVMIGSGATVPVDIRAIDPGADGNLDPGDIISVTTGISGLDGTATVVLLTGGTDTESDEDLRIRVLNRIRQPPMGGDANDYVQWTLAVAGVTRAWCAPLEMGIGTVTVRFMCDDLRATQGGFPTEADIAAVEAYLDSVRPVAVKDFFVEAPIPFDINFTLTDLEQDDAGIRAEIEASVRDMLMERAIPGQTIYRSWVDEAISSVHNVDHYDLDFEDGVMPSAGHLAILGVVTYA
jgi:uncharacterized phage protein gp47/JayE